MGALPEDAVSGHRHDEVIPVPVARSPGGTPVTMMGPIPSLPVPRLRPPADEGDCRYLFPGSGHRLMKVIAGTVDRSARDQGECVCRVSAAPGRSCQISMLCQEVMR